MANNINRREFIKRSTVTGAGAGLTLGMNRRTEAAFNTTDSPNGRITVGFIGVGARAHQVIYCARAQIELLRNSANVLNLLLPLDFLAFDKSSNYDRAQYR